METRLLEIGSVTFRARIGVGDDKNNTLFDNYGEAAWKSIGREELARLVVWAQDVLFTGSGLVPQLGAKVAPSVAPISRLTASETGKPLPEIPRLAPDLDKRRAESSVPFKQITTEQSTALAVGEAAFVDFSEGKPMPKGTIRQWDGAGGGK